MSRRVESLLRALKLVGQPRRYPDLVAEVLADAQLRFSDVRSLVRFAPNRYTRNTLFGCEGYEVLLLAWDKGTSSAVHDHGGSLCWFTPVAGAFDLRDYRVVEGGHEPGPASVHLVRCELGVTSGEVRHN